MAAFQYEFTQIAKPQLFSSGQAQAAARQVSRRNAMKQVGLAFHNYHDVYNRFPRHNGDAGNGPKGLSWRVYLLPFLEHAELHQRFKLDEPWDSEHNRKLIPEMPDIFQVPGVDKPGHTSIHVFTGKKALFHSEASGPRLRDMTDGTSNTLLAVVAGPDTAVEWTKPGGLEFAGDNGKKLLGKISEQFLALFADGFVRQLDSTIDEDILRKLIQPNDGEVLGKF